VGSLAPRSIIAAVSPRSVRADRRGRSPLRCAGRAYSGSRPRTLLRSLKQTAFLRALLRRRDAGHDRSGGECTHTSRGVGLRDRSRTEDKDLHESRALCTQSGADARLETPKRARSRSSGSRSGECRRSRWLARPVHESCKTVPQGPPLRCGLGSLLRRTRSGDGIERTAT